MEFKTVFLLGALASVSGASANWAISGSNVAVLTGNSATLKCDITRPANSTGKPRMVWLDGSEILFYGVDPDQADTARMSVSESEDMMSLTINSVTLTDEKSYTCKLSGPAVRPSVEGSVFLTTNQYPQEFTVTDTDESPVDGEEATIAVCTTKGSKPEPEMWFTDALGNEIELTDEPIVERDGVLFDKSISLKSTFTKDDHGKHYKCVIKRADGTTDSRDTGSINVKYAPSVYLQGVVPNSLEVRQEGLQFEASCQANGNPTPTIQWSFVPAENENFTFIPGELPSNFRVSADGVTLLVKNLAITGENLTNNGTFTCTASNGIGSDVATSFSLGVYAAPVTTVPTTTETTPKNEPQTASSDTAVIAGVVAVVAFVVIVAVILIIKYFMSHKGTYHTKELKGRGGDEERGVDENAADDDEDDAMLAASGAKRTEYFM